MFSVAINKLHAIKKDIAVIAIWVLDRPSAYAALL